MAFPGNETWLDALAGTGGQPANEEQKIALEQLRAYLLRAVQVYLHSRQGDTAGWSADARRHFAEDTVQETLLAIREKLDSFRGEARFTTWAYRLAVNLAGSELRRRRYRDISLEGLQERETAVLPPPLYQNREPAPEKAVEQQATLARLHQIIDEQLTDHQRTAVVNVYLLDRPIAEVAGDMALSRNALYKVLYDARCKIRRRLQPPGQKAKFKGQ